MVKWNEGNVRIFESSKSKFEWNLKFIPKVDLIKWSGISFHSWNLSSYNCLTHEHWRLPIFKFMSTYLRTPPSKELHKVSSCSKSYISMLFFFLWERSSFISHLENKIIFSGGKKYHLSWWYQKYHIPVQFFWKDHLLRAFGKRTYGFSCSATML